MRFDLPRSVKARFASLTKDDVAKLSDSVDDKTGCMLLAPVQFYDTRELGDERINPYRGVIIGGDLDGNVFMLLADAKNEKVLEDAVYFWQEESGQVFLCATSFDAFCDKGTLPVAEWKQVVLDGPQANSAAINDDDGFAEAKRSVDQWIADELVIMSDPARGPVMLADFLVRAADTQSSPEATLANLLDLNYVDEVFLDEEAVETVLQTIA